MNLPECYRLTEEEIAAIEGRYDALVRDGKALETLDRMIADAAAEKAAREALKDVGEEMEKPCPHHHFLPGIKRRDCGTCMRQMSDALRFGSSSGQLPASLRSKGKEG